MRYLGLKEVLRIHERVIATSGGDPTILDINKVDSAVAQPLMTFGGNALYPSLHEKAAALGFSLINNHGFLDGNKRTGHADIELFLRRNGYEILAPVDEQERVILSVADGSMSRDRFAEWLRTRMYRKGQRIRPDLEVSYIQDKAHGPALRRFRETIEHQYARARASGVSAPLVILLETRFDPVGRDLADRFFANEQRLSMLAERASETQGVWLCASAPIDDCLAALAPSLPEVIDRIDQSALSLQHFPVLVVAGQVQGFCTFPIPDVPLGPVSPTEGKHVEFVGAPSGARVCWSRQFVGRVTSWNSP